MCGLLSELAETEDRRETPEPSGQETCRVVAVGIFDGVHLGHRSILRETVSESEARSSGGVAVIPSVLTFSGIHKSGSASAGMIFGPEEKEEFLRKEGIREIIVKPFSDVRDMDCETFVRRVLIGELSAEAAVVGEDFRFGHGRTGNAETLAELLRKEGKACRILPKTICCGQPVSSTEIRSLLKEGHVEKANLLMGHPMTWILPVVSGNHIGRSLGYPTINQTIPADRVKMKFGVYLVSAEAEGRSYRGLCNIGVKPTVGGRTPVAETYLDGFSGDLYGKSVKISALRFLRPEEKFPDLDRLREQIGKDISSAFGKEN